MLDASPRSPCPSRGLGTILIAGGAALLVGVILCTAGWAEDLGDALTRNTIRLSLAWYAAALLLMMSLQTRDWKATTPLGQFARGCWSWALAVFIIHLIMAFHFYHHWSHADAVERTRQLSGLGEGVYASYVFAVVWGADVALWHLRPVVYARRKKWIDAALHAFMLFMVFNSMVVFESGGIRVAGWILFCGLFTAWLLLRPRWLRSRDVATC